jgi:hypothetical protein
MQGGIDRQEVWQEPTALVHEVVDPLDPDGGVDRGLDREGG